MLGNHYEFKYGCNKLMVNEGFTVNSLVSISKQELYRRLLWEG